jgi:hypothetical protein
MADVEGDHASCAPLQQAVGETAGGGTDIETIPPRYGDAEGRQGRPQLVSASTHKARTVDNLDIVSG